MSKYTIMLIFYFLLLTIFSVYSYSQIDLNLTLSSNFLYQEFQNAMIGLGYYNRFLSALIYGVVLIALFILYGLFLKKSQIIFSIRKLFISISIVATILLFSFPAFSYDIFNYMFDARIITKYHLNPYEHMALDFPEDLWTRFMRWTHRTYPYGPLWLVITIPFSFIGAEKFIPTLVLYKILFTLAYLFNAYFIYKILKIIDSKNSIKGTVFYAFNPLIITESLLSPHLDSVMLTFLLLGIYFLVCKNKLFTFFSILLSGSIKFATFILLPLSILKKKEERIVFLYFILLIIPTAIQIYMREAYPWYFIPLIGVASLLISNKVIRMLSFGLSLITSFQYLPYLYMGVYSDSLAHFKSLIFYIPLLIILVVCGYQSIMNRKTYVTKK